MGMGVAGSPVPVHWVPTPSRPLAWGALPILPFNCTSKETTKVELMSALVEDVNAVGDVVDGDVEGEGAVEDVYPPTDAFTTTAPGERGIFSFFSCACFSRSDVKHCNQSRRHPGSWNREEQVVSRDLASS